MSKSLKECTDLARKNNVLTKAEIKTILDSRNRYAANPEFKGRADTLAAEEFARLSHEKVAGYEAEIKAKGGEPQFADYNIETELTKFKEGKITIGEQVPPITPLPPSPPSSPGPPGPPGEPPVPPGGEIPGTESSEFANWQAPNALLGHVSDELTSIEGIKQRARGFRKTWQDKYVSFRDVQRQIVKMGGSVTDLTDAYNKFTLIESKVGSQFKEIEERFITPLAKEIDSSGLSVKQIEDYMQAKFAPSRNARIAEINPKFPDGGSGITNADALAYLESLTPEQTTKLEAIADIVYAAQKYKLDALLKSGRIDKEYYNKLISDKFYVPLKGFANQTALVSNTEAVGRGFDQAHAIFKRAKGRESLAKDILYTSFRDVEAGIINAEKTLVGNSVLNLVRDNPNESLWKIIPMKVETFFNKQSGQVEQRMIKDYHLLARDPNVFIAWEKGKPFAIEFRDNPLGESALARAVKNMGVDQVPKFVAHLGKLNRYLAYVNTALSPGFMLTNPIRDLQTALAKTFGEYDATIAAEVLTNLPKAAMGVAGGISKNVVSKKIAQFAPEEAAFYKEYERGGGKVDHFRQKTIDEMKSELDFAIKAVQGGVKGNAVQLARALKHTVDNTNAVLENMTRLSLYIALRKRDYTVHQAATAAKNLTVNFSRRGESGVLANSLYLFYNASVQGAHLTVGLLKNAKIRQRIIYPAMGAVAGLTQYNILAGGEDEDGEPLYFKNTSEYERERNLIFMWPDGSGRFNKIPLGYGLNVPLNTAAALVHVANGRDAMKESLWLASSAWNSFSPLSENSFWNIIAPTILDPGVDIIQNKNYAGREIVPVRNKFEKVPVPDSQLAFQSTPQIYKDTAEKINELTGGDKQKGGFVDWSPESIQHYVEFFTGGAGSFIKRLAVPDKEFQHLPIVQRFYGGMNKYATRERYYTNRTEIFLLEKRKEHLKEEKMNKEYPDDVRTDYQREYLKFREENKEGLKLVERFKATDKKLKEFRIKRKKAKSKDAKEKWTLKIREKQMLMNKKYNDLFMSKGVIGEFDFLNLNDEK